MKLFLGLLGTLVILAISLPSEAFIDVCWRNVTIGVRQGERIYCKKCSKMKYTTNLEEANCERFIQEVEAREWMRKNCDCR